MFRPTELARSRALESVSIGVGSNADGGCVVEEAAIRLPLSVKRGVRSSADLDSLRTSWYEV
jgi:hypothetical protein